MAARIKRLGLAQWEEHFDEKSKAKYRTDLDVLKAYAENAIAADGDLLGKPVMIAGRVESIERDAQKRAVVLFEGARSTKAQLAAKLRKVRAQIVVDDNASLEVAAVVKPGDLATVICDKGAGADELFVTLEDCTLVFMKMLLQASADAARSSSPSASTSASARP